MFPAASCLPPLSVEKDLLHGTQCFGFFSEDAGAVFVRGFFREPNKTCSSEVRSRSHPHGGPVFANDPVGQMCLCINVTGAVVVP